MRSVPLLGLAYLWVLASPPPGKAQESARRPTGNYHAHLVSEPASRLSGQRPLAGVELPPEVARVLRDYERFNRPGSDSAFAALFTEDALTSGQSGWVRGRQAIRSACCSRAPLRLRAQGFAAADTVAYIAGIVAIDSQPSPRDVTKLMLTLRKGGDGRWLIAARLAEEIRPPVPGLGTPFTAKQLIAQMDSLGIRRSLVLSVAYWFGAPASIMPKPGGEPSVEQVQPGPPYRFRLRISWTDGTGSACEQVFRVEERRQPLEVPGPFRDPAVDPRVELLYREAG